MQLEQLHQHKRRKKQKRRSWRVEFLDNLVLIVAVVYPLSTIPQILDIWVGKNVAGVSLLTWTLFLFLQSILLLYGLAHKDKKLTVMWGLWVLMYFLVVVGLVLFR
ncbi:MAG: hypothetical protein KKA90_01205 [Nanoarchaeota archaeon]|nr:hypothetical protein [Nanoarchaeota archaeon]